MICVLAQAVEYLEFKAEVPKAKEAKRLMAERIKEKKAEAKALVAAAADKKAAKEIKKEQKDMMDDLKEEMKECKQKFVDKKAEVTAQKGSEVSEQTLTNCCAPFSHWGVVYRGRPSRDIRVEFAWASAETIELCKTRIARFTPQPSSVHCHLLARSPRGMAKVEMERASHMPAYLVVQRWLSPHGRCDAHTTRVFSVPSLSADYPPD